MLSVHLNELISPFFSETLRIATLDYHQKLQGQCHVFRSFYVFVCNQPVLMHMKTTCMQIKVLAALLVLQTGVLHLQRLEVRLICSSK